MSKKSIRKVLSRVHKAKLFDPSYRVSDEDYGAIAELYTRARFYDAYSKAHSTLDPTEKKRCWKELEGIVSNPVVFSRKFRKFYLKSCITDFSSPDGLGYMLKTQRIGEFDFDRCHGLWLSHELTQEEAKLLDSILEEGLVKHLIDMIDYLKNEVLSWEDDKVSNALDEAKFWRRVDQIERRQYRMQDSVELALLKKLNYILAE